MCSLNLKNKNVTVVGLGRSGMAAAELLQELKAKVSVTEINNSSEILKRANRLKNSDVRVEVGKHTLDFIRGQDLIIASPGVSDKAKPLQYANKYNITVIGEIELGYRCCEVPIIAVTGTNGKTTVSTMINKFLNKTKSSSILCGNIGIPFTKIIKEKKHNTSFIILEISSFQLERTYCFKPFIGVLLNIDADHLDRHINVKSYKLIKYNLFSKQTKNDWSIIVDPDYNLVNEESKSVFLENGVVFSEDDFFNKSIYSKYKNILSNKKIDINKRIVLLVLSLLGKDIDACLDEILNFEELEHRLEVVTKVNGISFINDSKSTNISSVKWALNKYDNIILIAGGRNKNLDFNTIPSDLKNKVKLLFVIGEAKQEIKEAFLSVCPVYDVNSLGEAVSQSYKLAHNGDNILFSPMCSSFDMFDNYKHRGEVFKKEVSNLINI